jgi:hypothetical protein
MNTPKEAINEMKQEIKRLSEEQKKDKQILRQPHNNNTWKTMENAFYRAMRITILLNMYYRARKSNLDLHSVYKYYENYKYLRTKKELEDKYMIQVSQVVKDE